MDFDFIKDDFHKSIKNKKKLLKDLSKYTDIDPKLIKLAINHMKGAPHECSEEFIKTPKIEELKKNNPTEYKKIISAKKALSALMNNAIVNANEKKIIKLMEERISQEYEIYLLDKKALMDSYRSQEDINSIEEYKNYPDGIFSWEFDKHLNTDKQCEGKLVTMLYDYLWQLAEVVNEARLTGNKYDYKKKDVFELIAEILNLHWKNKYD